MIRFPLLISHTPWCDRGVVSRKNPADWPQPLQLPEATPDKKVTWALRLWEAPADLGPASIIQLLNEPGGPVKPGERQR